MRMRRRNNLAPRMEACESVWIHDPEALRGKWRSLMPSCRELRVEVGCGKGKFTVETAEAEPDVLLIAIERVQDALVLAMEAAIRKGLKNVFFVSLDAAGNREFSFYRNPSADLFLDEKQITPEMFENCAVLHFCSVDLVDYPVRGAHRRAIELAKQAGAFVSFDPNVRLPLWSSPADCQAAIRQFLPCADLVKLSDDEIEFVTGCADERAAAEKLFALGVRMVVVTRGANGSAAYTPSCHAEAAAISVPVTDTTGAGDSFIGSFLYQLTRDGVSADELASLSEQTLAEYLRFSARCASLTVQHRGAVMPTQADLCAACPG